jgi:hypothetical protein
MRDGYIHRKQQLLHTLLLLLLYTTHQSSRIQRKFSFFDLFTSCKLVLRC